MYSDYFLHLKTWVLQEAEYNKQNMGVNVTLNLAWSHVAVGPGRDAITLNQMLNKQEETYPTLPSAQTSRARTAKADRGALRKIRLGLNSVNIILLRHGGDEKHAVMKDLLKIKKIIIKNVSGGRLLHSGTAEMRWEWERRRSAASSALSESKAFRGQSHQQLIKSRLSIHFKVRGFKYPISKLRRLLEERRLSHIRLCVFF